MNLERKSVLETTVIALPWMLIPLLAAHFASAWSVLPARIASHFDLQGRPNGWQSPATFAVWSFIPLTLGLAVFTFSIARALRLRSMYVPATLVAYGVVGGVFTLLWQVLDHAAYGSSMADVWPIPAAFPILGLCLSLLVLASLGREWSPASGKTPGEADTNLEPHPAAVEIASERHRAPLQLLLIVPGLLIGGWLAIKGPGPTRFLGIFLLAAMAWIFVAVLEGFLYLVRTDGVLVRGFLLPLRFIPRSSIRTYRVEPWRGMGYGIRLTSTGTAYIWGGRTVVNIVTDSGDVMLGHTSPERLISDLDRMMHTSLP